MSKPTVATLLPLLRDAVRARVAAWDAARLIEREILGCDDSELLDGAIDGFAVACYVPESAEMVVTEEKARELLAALLKEREEA